MALAAGGGVDALGMLGGSVAGSGSDPLGGGGSLEQQLREQQQRVRDLEIILADERSEAQSVSGVNMGGLLCECGGYGRLLCGARELLCVMRRVTRSES